MRRTVSRSRAAFQAGLEAVSAQVQFPATPRILNFSRLFKKAVDIQGERGEGGRGGRGWGRAGEGDAKAWGEAGKYMEYGFAYIIIRSPYTHILST